MATVDAHSSQKALDMILAATGMRESDHKGKVTIQGKDPILASRHRFGETQAAFGIALSQLWQLRGGKPQDVTTNVRNERRRPRSCNGTPRHLNSPSERSRARSAWCGVLRNGWPTRWGAAWRPSR